MTDSESVRHEPGARRRRLMDADRTLLSRRLARNRQHAGRRPIHDRAVLTRILFVLRSGIPWKMLPKEMWRRQHVLASLVRWQRGGVWKRLHRMLLTSLRAVNQPVLQTLMVSFTVVVCDELCHRASEVSSRMGRSRRSSFSDRTKRSA
nr:transposase and inactivated derivatives-like protein [uncultured bacterium]